MDIGGFMMERRYEKATGETLDEWRELNTRWFQFGAFCPIFRSHGQYPFREIYNIADAGSVQYESMWYYDKLRYTLMPYIYTLGGQAYFDDQTIMRGLVMDFNHDPKVLDVADQYMFGPAFLVNPVTQYKARERQVYLPTQAGWYNWYDNKFFEGGQTLTVSAPLEQMPLFVKAGSIVPTGPDIQYSTERSDPITLRVYEGADGTFSIYEDEGLNYNYEKDAFSIIPLSYDQNAHALTIGRRFGAFEGMQESRTFSVLWVSPEGVVVDPKPHVYQGEVLVVTKPGK